MSKHYFSNKNFIEAFKNVKEKNKYFEIYEFETGE